MHCYSSLPWALLVLSIKSADDLVLSGREFDGGAGFEQRSLRQLAVRRHLLELEEHLLVLSHVREHQVHAAHGLDLVPQVHLALDLGLVRHELRLGRRLETLFDLLGNVLVVHGFKLSRRALLEDVVQHAGDFLGEEGQ